MWSLSLKIPYIVLTVIFVTSAYHLSLTLLSRKLSPFHLKHIMASLPHTPSIATLVFGGPLKRKIRGCEHHSYKTATAPAIQDGRRVSNRAQSATPRPAQGGCTSSWEEADLVRGSGSRERKRVSREEVALARFHHATQNACNCKTSGLLLDFSISYFQTVVDHRERKPWRAKLWIRGDDSMWAVASLGRTGLTYLISKNLTSTWI